MVLLFLGYVILLLNPFLIALSRELKMWKVCNKYVWIMGYILLVHLTILL